MVDKEKSKRSIKPYKGTISHDKLWLDIAMKDLVKLATLANNVIIQGSFSGAISDEVNEVLLMCKHINETLVEQIKEGKDES